MNCERGQATIEWVGVVLLTAVVLAAAAAVAGPNVDGRSFGGFLTHRILCAVRGGCDDGDAQLVAAYGRGDAELLRRHAPNIVYEPGERQLPVAWTECRKVSCANAPDDRDLDAHRTDAGRRATVYTRVLRRGGRTYLQYWFYYPDSNSTFAGSHKAWGKGVRVLRAVGVLRGEHPYIGYHRDDWEGYQLRIGRDGQMDVRSTSHGDYKYCKHIRICTNRWGPATGWTRVSRWSHAGHIPLSGVLNYTPRRPGRHLRERTSTAEGLRLIPLETVGRRGYRPLAKDVKPPWRKRVYRDPESNES